jgi:hypothetical protein
MPNDMALFVAMGASLELVGHFQIFLDKARLVGPASASLCYIIPLQEIQIYEIIE